MPVSINIKMYRVGELGDCFLLTFNSEEEQKHMLIDCGSFRNGAKSIARMKEIAADIKTKLGEKPLDIIVGTHQHNDHLSGFVHAHETFKAMKPEQIWLSWLDDPGNAKANEIGSEYNNYLKNLNLINLRIQKRWDVDGEIKNRLKDLMDFYGLKKTVRNSDFPPSLPKQAVEILRKLGSKKPKYLSPGDAFSLPGISSDAIKVYVLGPPLDEDLLYDKDPNKNETFDPELAMHNMQAGKMLSGLDKYAKNRKEEDVPYPFNEPYFESENINPVWDRYYKKSNTWRQIGEDWLKQAERLALWLDGFTNNSSLVLAFEIVKTKKVLLFAADAQTGNWNSWRSIKWKKVRPNFNWLTLMNNTVLYKTGHHGSHNSTLVEALNNMTHEELVAMIPVDRNDPNIKKAKGGWKMPAKNLLEEIKKRSHNRVLTMDEGIMESPAWDKLPFEPKQTNLYIEYEIRE